MADDTLEAGQGFHTDFSGQQTEGYPLRTQKEDYADTEATDKPKSKISLEDRIDRLESLARQHFGRHNMPDPEEEEDDNESVKSAELAARKGRARPGPQY